MDENDHLTNRDTDKAVVINAFFSSAAAQMTDQRGLSTLICRTMTENDQLPEIMWVC